MVADVQSWLDVPVQNFGWLLLGEENTFPTSKRFDTRENPEPLFRPMLEIDYDLPIPTDISTWGKIKATYQ